MEKQPQSQPCGPHVLILPFPAQGHISPMLCLAMLLSKAGVPVTFLNSHHNHRRIFGTADLLQSLTSRFPNLHLASISDGLPVDDSSDDLERIRKLIASSSIKTSMKPLLGEFLLSPALGPSELRLPPVSCIIADGIMSIAIDVGEKVGIPVITFRTFSCCCLWTYFCLPDLIQQGKLPFQDDGMDMEFNGVPGAEGLLRRRDLPGICRLKQLDDVMFRFFLEETIAVKRASGIILNTFNDLESPMLSNTATIFSNIYTVGPLHALVKSKPDDIAYSSAPRSDGSLRIKDRSCMTWLDSQPSRSVLYVSFGSLVQITTEQLAEFWHGLTSCGKPFLWVIREDAIATGGKDEELESLLAEVRIVNEKSCVVSWAPQEEVLAHRAVGGFLTHCGWNSTLESIVAGVPMLCWPQIGDQQINSRWVSEVWRIGLDMKDTCDRLTIERMVKALMDDRKEEIMKSMGRISRLARKSVGRDGSSSKNLERLIEDITKMGGTR